MLLDSPAVARLIDAFRRLPGIGRRTAERLAFHLLSAPDDEASELSEAVRIARDKVRLCSVCANLTEQDPCSVCEDTRRDRSIVCVVEQPTGAMAIEKGGAYRGLYHVLHGALNPLEGIGPQDLHIEDLLKRVAQGEIKEVIVASNATAEGEATALYLARELQASGVKVSRIAHGVPMGSGLEFVDELTLSHALDGRKPI